MNEVRVDDKEVMKALGNLDEKKMVKAYKDGLKKSVQPIYKQAKINLRKSGIKHVSKPYVNKKTGAKGKTMLSGIKTSVMAKTAGEEWAKVHIMGEFRLKWFEKGTTLRKTRKGWDRGRISPHWFFRDAVNQKSKECEEMLDECIKESIMKAYNKK